jgi:hypothetical protein
MTDQLDPLDESAVKEAVDAALTTFADAKTLDDLKQAKIDHTGDKSPLALANRAIGSLDKADKAAAGKIVGKSRDRSSRPTMHALPSSKPNATPPCSSKRPSTSPCPPTVARSALATRCR